MISAHPGKPASALGEAEDAIAAERVGVAIGGQPILRDIDLNIARGSFVSLIGPSGCGKSTLLKAMAGLVAPSAGRVAINGLPPAEAARRRMIGLVFQDANLLPWKTALDNATTLLAIADKSLSRAQLRERGQAMLELVGLRDSGHKRPNELSGGMRQRVSIARALALDPAVLLMDEPFGALDAITRDAMGQSLLEIWRRTGKTVVLVTHSIDEAITLSRRVHVLGINPGRIVHSLDVDLPHQGELSDTENPAYLRMLIQLKAMLHAGHNARDAH